MQNLLSKSYNIKISTERIFLFLLKFILFLVPIVYLPFFVFAFNDFKALVLSSLVSLAFVFWLALLLTKPEYRFKKQILFFLLPLFAFIFWMTISGVFGVDPYRSFWSVYRQTGLVTLYFLFLFSLMIASAVQVWGMGFVKKLLAWSIVAGVIATFSIWFDTPNVTGKGGGFIGNSSFAGAYMVFNIFFAGFLLLGFKLKKHYRGIIFLAFMFMATSPLFINFLEDGLSFGQARGATLGVIAGVIFSFFVYLFLSGKTYQKVLGTLGVAGIIISGIFIWVSLVTPETYLSQQFIEHAGGDRFIVWNISKEAVLEKPFLGWGPENFSYAFHEYYDKSIFMDEPNFDRAHNIFWDTAVSGGIPLVLFYIGIFISLFWLFWLSHKKNIFNRWQITILCGLVVAYVVQNLFVFDMIPSFLMWYLLVGFVAGSASPAFSPSEPKFSWEKQSRLKKNLIIISIFVLIFTVFIYTTLLPFMRIYLIHDFLKFF